MRIEEDGRLELRARGVKMIAMEVLKNRERRNLSIRTNARSLENEWHIKGGTRAKGQRGRRLQD